MNVSPVETGVLRRALLFWLLMRILAAVMIAFAAESSPLGAGPPHIMGFKGALIVAVATGFVGLIDVRRRNEDLLLANLGTAPSRIRVLAFAPPALLETLALLAQSA